MAKQTSQKVLRRSQARIPARSASGRRSPIVAIAVVIVVLGTIAAIAGFVLRPAAESAFILWYARQATSLRIDASSVEKSGDTYAFTDVSASTPGGAASLSASRVVVTVRDRDARVELESPHFAFSPDRLRGDEVANARAAMERYGFGSAQLAVGIRGGNALLVTGDVPVPTLSFDEIAGSAVVQARGIHYDATAKLEEDGRSYPLAAHSELAPDGSATNELTAAAMPLGPLVDFFPAESDVRVLGGTLRDVSISDGASLHATAHLESGEATLGSRALEGVHGSIVFADNGVGSPGLAGTLQGVPFSAAGEVHDLGPHFGFLQSGSTDFASLVALAEKISDEPRIKSIAVEAEAPGITYGQYAVTTDHGPLAITIVGVDPKEPTLRFDTALAEDRIISGGERTSAMGLRTGAVAGLNGDYFDIGRTYQPQGMLVKSGQLIRGPVERAALAIDKDKHVTFGEFVLVGNVREGGTTYPVTQVNDWPVGAATVITPAFGKEIPADPGTTFARLEPLAGDAKRFRVTAVEPDDAPIPVSFGVAFGAKLGAKPHVGEIVALSYRTDPPTGDAVAAIGGGPILVRDGDPFEDPHAPAPDERNYRWPVIAVAQTNAGRIMLVAVDGRHPERSVGMMRPEFSDLLVRLGARNAMALDSGGSVTLVSRKVGDANVSVRNVPSDNSAERWISDALFVYSSAPAATIVPVAAAPTPVPEVRPSP